MSIQLYVLHFFVPQITLHDVVVYFCIMLLLCSNCITYSRRYFKNSTSVAFTLSCWQILILIAGTLSWYRLSKNFGRIVFSHIQIIRKFPVQLYSGIMVISSIIVKSQFKSCVFFSPGVFIHFWFCQFHNISEKLWLESSPCENGGGNQRKLTMRRRRSKEVRTT